MASAIDETSSLGLSHAAAADRLAREGANSVWQGDVADTTVIVVSAAGADAQAAPPRSQSAT